MNIPKAVSIGYRAFHSCSLTSVNIPNATSIGDEAFAGWSYAIPNESLANVNAPKAESIGKWAFSDCIALTSVSLLATASIGDEAFWGCVSLTSFNLIGSGPLSVIDGGKALVRNDTELIAYPAASGDIEISGITDIGTVFRGNTAITSVSFPDVTTIGDWAFSECATGYMPEKSLTSVSFPSVTSIGYGAFDNCYYLDTVNIPKVEDIGGGVFSGATGNIYKATGNITHTPDRLIITMGNVAPRVGNRLVAQGGIITGTVTIKVPAGATGYGSIPATYSGTNSTQNWGNAFRGIGWDGTSYGDGTVNSNITLNIEYE